MSSRKQSKTRKLIPIFISCIVFAIGYYFMNVVSRIFEVPLGITFHVIFGSFLMAIAGVYIVYSLKKMLSPKKRKRIKRMHIQNNSEKKSTTNK
jgi:hypothetical protein